MIPDSPALSSEAPQSNRQLRSMHRPNSEHEPQENLDTKTDELTDRRS
jgi:hypothetical protein